MKLSVAQKYAEKICETLSPFCERIAIAGSIRRRRPEVNDIDLVMIPKPEGLGLIVDRCRETCTPLQVGQVNLSFQTQTGIRLDLYMAHPRKVDLFDIAASNWGALLLCRTGSKEFNVWLAKQAEALNLQYRPYMGIVNNHGDLVAGETEEEIFKALNLSFIQPEARER